MFKAIVWLIEISPIKVGHTNVTFGHCILRNEMLRGSTHISYVARNIIQKYNNNKIIIIYKKTMVDNTKRKFKIHINLKRECIDVLPKTQGPHKFSAANNTLSILAKVLILL